MKKHPLLASLIAGDLPEETVEVLGHTYVLKLLKPEGEDWASAHTEGSGLTAALMNIRKPTLAASLQSVDGIPVETLFQPGDEMDAKLKEALMNDAKFIRSWRREQIFEFLREDADNFLVDELYNVYSKMSRKHREALANFQKGTTSLS